ncbi:hypothetical protein M9458_012408, partial [Cirrhinus mrigala]
DQMRAGFTSHILQSSPPYTPPCDGAQELHLGSPDKQRGLKPNEGERDPADKAAVYDIVGSPAKDPTKLILRQWSLGECTPVQTQKENLKDGKRSCHGNGT